MSECLSVSITIYQSIVPTFKTWGSSGDLVLNRSPAHQCLASTWGMAYQVVIMKSL